MSNYNSSFKVRSFGRGRKVKLRIKRRFARCKITLMRVDYEGKTIRITLKPGEYLEVS